MKNFFATMLVVCLLAVSSFAGVVDSFGYTPAPVCQPDQISMPEAPCRLPGTTDANSAQQSNSSGADDDDGEDADESLVNDIENFLKSFF